MNTTGAGQQESHPRAHIRIKLGWQREVQYPNHLIDGSRRARTTEDDYISLICTDRLRDDFSRILPEAGGLSTRAGHHGVRVRVQRYDLAPDKVFDKGKTLA